MKEIVLWYQETKPLAKIILSHIFLPSNSKSSFAVQWIDKMEQNYKNETLNEHKTSYLFM
jgi:hypothetical protein